MLNGNFSNENIPRLTDFPQKVGATHFSQIYRLNTQPPLDGVRRTPFGRRLWFCPHPQMKMALFYDCGLACAITYMGILFNHLFEKRTNFSGGLLPGGLLLIASQDIQR